MSFSVSAITIVSVSYLATYALVAGFLSPLQSHFGFGELGLYSLMFLPHGVRMLCMYFYRSMGIIYLSPSVLLMWYIETEINGLALLPLSPVINVLACYIGWLLVFGININTDSYRDAQTWVKLIIAGAFGSIINSTGHALLYVEVISATEMFLGYLVGDMVGQFLLMLALVYLFRIIRLFNSDTF